MRTFRGRFTTDQVAKISILLHDTDITLCVFVHLQYVYGLDADLQKIVLTD